MSKSLPAGDEVVLLGAAGERARKVLTLTPEQVDTLELLAGFGNTVEEAAAVLGVSTRTLARRIKTSPEAADAWANGKARLRHECHRRVLSGMRAGNERLTIFAAKNWAGMRDQHHVEVASEKPAPTGETVRRRMAELMGEDPNNPAAGMEDDGEGS